MQQALPYAKLLPLRVKRLPATVISSRSGFKDIAPQFKDASIQLTAFTWLQNAKHHLSAVGLYSPKIDTTVFVCNVDPQAAGPEIIAEDLKPILEGSGVKVLRASDFISALLKTEYNINLQPIFSVEKAFHWFYPRAGAPKLSQMAHIACGAACHQSSRNRDKLSRALAADPLYLSRRPLSDLVLAVIAEELQYLSQMHQVMVYSFLPDGYRRCVRESTSRAMTSAVDPTSFRRPPINEYIVTRCRPLHSRSFNKQEQSASSFLSRRPTRKEADVVPFSSSRGSQRKERGEDNELLSEKERAPAPTVPSSGRHETSEEGLRREERPPQRTRVEAYSGKRGTEVKLKAP